MAIVAWPEGSRQWSSEGAFEKSISMTKERHMKNPQALWSRLLILLLLLLPFTLLFLAPGTALTMRTFGVVVFWFALLGCFLVILFILGMPETQMPPGRDLGPRMLADAEQPEAVKQVMTVSVATEGADGVRIFRGRLRESAEAAYQELKRAFGAQTVPMLQEDEDAGAAVVLMPRSVERERLEHPTRPAVHLLLFALTVVTTTWAGAAHEGVNLVREPGRFAVGLPYSLGLLAILGVHELGHYFMARRHGIKVTPPFFILHSGPVRARDLWRVHSDAIAN
jgi:hypothetical protein